jgi:hypothetical protein
MVEIYPALFVGNHDDYETDVAGQDGWRVVQACREPYHRRALGYKGQSAPKDDPEYLFARGADRLILNMIDADDPAYIPRELIDESLAFIAESLAAGQQVLVHCNQGQSRAPSIALLYLATHTALFYGLEFRAAEERYLSLYPNYLPRAGIRGFILAHWSAYCRGVPNEVPLGHDHDVPDSPARNRS